MSQVVSEIGSRAPAEKKPTAQAAIRRHLLAGLAIVALLAGGVGGLAATTELSGAVIAPGNLVVESNVKKVQHPTGGVVGEVRVRDGDKVKAGDIVVRLDETITQANLSIVVKSLNELQSRLARLEAERDNVDKIVFPADLVARAADPELSRAMVGEKNLFEFRKSARAGQKAQLRERIAQLKEEIQGLTGQVAAKKRESELIAQELEGVRDLWRKNLVQIQRVTALERDAARIEGERGALVASTAQAKGKISETELQILQIDQDLRSEVAKELREVQGKIAELVERKVAAEDQLKRIDIRAPQDGMVHQSTVHTVGGVITPGEAVMLIVPEADALTVEAKLAPQDIDQVRVGQSAGLRFSAFNQRTTPELEGAVARVSADLTTDQRTGAAYYVVRIAISEKELARLEGLRLVPGMPVETFIRTGERTVLSYVMKPFTDQLNRSFRGR
jgi:HlyD family secretion protein